MAIKDAVGRYGEDLVARRVAAWGWEVLDRNWRCAEGEVDIVARDGDELVVIEVKTRRGDGFGSGLEAVTARKASRLRRLTAAWLDAHDLAFPAVRIDVAAVRLPRAGAPAIDYVKAAA